jgi:hypothetical protein
MAIGELARRVSNCVISIIERVIDLLKMRRWNSPQTVNEEME